MLLDEPLVRLLYPSAKRDTGLPPQTSQLTYVNGAAQLPSTLLSLARIRVQQRVANQLLPPILYPATSERCQIARDPGRLPVAGFESVPQRNAFPLNALTTRIRRYISQRISQMGKTLVIGNRAR